MWRKATQIIVLGITVVAFHAAGILAGIGESYNAFQVCWWIGVIGLAASIMMIATAEAQAECDRRNGEGE